MSLLVVGVGAMGSAVAARLADSGVEVRGIDPFVVRAAARSAGGAEAEVTTADGIRVWSDLATAAATMEVPPTDVLIFVRLPDQVAQVLEELGRLAFFDGVPVAVMSTLAPSDARELASRFGTARPLAETPVSGGVAGARDGTLTVLAHGPAGSWIDAVAQRVLWFDEPGQPAAAKLLNNLLAAANVQALAAVLLAAEDHGLAAERMLEVVGLSSGASWMTPHFRDFPVDLLWKDVLLLDADTPVRLPGLSGVADFTAQISAARDALGSV